jgi:peptide methionine sulfoxide reductase MsrA
VGTQYRSIIFCENEDQVAEARAFIEVINTSSTQGAPVVTEVTRIPTEGPGQFFSAEAYHQNYFAENQGNRYCQLVINPKLEKVQKELAEFLK